MQLKKINKERYGTHYKQIMIGSVIVLAVIALSISTLLIQLVGNPDGSNFWLNLVGVIVAGIVVASLFRRYREHEYMYEVMYVWDLKQMLNKIYRKQKKIKEAIAEGDREAMVIMNWSYQGSKQLYLLDNNTITLDDLQRAMDELEQTVAEHNFTVTTEEFRSEMLDKY